MSTASVIQMPETNENLDVSHRDERAYRAAESNISFAEFVKAVGVLAAALLLLVTIAFSQRSAEELLLGVFLAGAAGVGLYSLGAILSVQAHTLRATLESAARSAPAVAAGSGGFLPVVRAADRKRLERTP